MWGSRLSQQSLQGEEASSEGGLYEAPAAGVASSSIPGGFGGGTSNLSKSASSSSLLRASLSRTLSSGAGLGGLGGGAAAEERGGLSGWAGLEGRAEPLSRSASGLLAVSERERFDGRSGSVTDLSAALQRAGLGEEAPSPLARVSSRFALASAQQPLAATCEDSLPSFPGHPLAGAFGSFNCDGPQPPSVARPLPVPQQLPAHSFAQPGPLLYSPEQIAHLLQMQQMQCALPALPLPGYPPAYLPPFGQPVAPGCGFGMEGAAEASAFYAAYYAHLAAGAGAAGGVGYLGGVGMAGFPGQLYGSAAPFYPPYYAGLDLCLLQRAGGREPHGAGGYGAPPRASPPGSRLLEEFRASRSSRFELRHLAGHVLEFASDQHGSRFIQHQLESAPAGDCQLVFAELQPYAPRLMDDVFGNYVIQKFLEHGTEAQRALLLAQLTGRVLPLSLQMYGCRVVQKALEVLPPEGQARLIDELEEHLQQCVADQNGNHVIQRCIQCAPTQRPRIMAALRGCGLRLAQHAYGCRVVQRVLEHCSAEERDAMGIIQDVLAAAAQLSRCQYGNYVCQHVLEHGTPAERKGLLAALAGQAVELSRHKFASNVVEACLRHGDAADRAQVLAEFAGSESLLSKDQFGNYVLQYVLEHGPPEERLPLLRALLRQAPELQRHKYAQNVLAKCTALFGEVAQAAIAGTETESPPAS